MPECLKWTNISLIKLKKQPLLTINVTFLVYIVFTVFVSVFFLIIQHKKFKNKVIFYLFKFIYIYSL